MDTDRLMSILVKSQRYNVSDGSASLSLHVIELTARHWPWIGRRRGQFNPYSLSLSLALHVTVTAGRGFVFVFLFSFRPHQSDDEPPAQRLASVFSFTLVCRFSCHLVHSPASLYGAYDLPHPRLPGNHHIIYIVEKFTIYAKKWQWKSNQRWQQVENCTCTICNTSRVFYDCSK